MKHLDLYRIAAGMLSYDPTTGVLTWQKTFNFKGGLVGKRAGSVYSDGYRRVRLQGVRLLEHRIAWYMARSEFPEHIDHKNRNRADNRLENLRPATMAENMRNKARQSNNTSGFKGVGWSKRDSRWTAQIRAHGKHHWLGYYPTAEAAALAYSTASKELHGQFSRV